MRTVITIARQFGSGGRQIGVRLSQALGVPLYGEEILKTAAERSGLDEKLFHNFDERPRSLLYSIAMDSYLFPIPGGAGDSLEQQVHLATFEAVRHVAEEGPCVIIGRCADYALMDHPGALRLFIYAPLARRVETVAAREGLDLEKARSLVQRTDKRRAAHYEYYTARKWGALENYDFCLNSSAFGPEGTVSLIRELVDRKEGR